MQKKITYLILVIILLSSCKINYSFSGINIGKGIKTFQVNYIPNNAMIVEPGLNNEVRNELIDRIISRTNLTEAKTDGDLVYDAEISEYSVTPVAMTADQTASQSRLTIAIKLNYTNNKKEEDNFDKTYKWHYDFAANQNLNSIKDEAHKEILKKIIGDIFNETLAKW
jgi:hypothetical protein